MKRLPLPAAFKRKPSEHWLERHEREVDEHLEAMRKRLERDGSPTSASQGRQAH